MNQAIKRALETERTIDITTTGRRSGKPRRIEIWFDNVDGEVYITGLPGKRDWYANLLADPSLTFHLKQSVVADLPAKATLITDADEKRRLLEQIRATRAQHQTIDEWVMGSPLIRVDFD